MLKMPCPEKGVGFKTSPCWSRYGCLKKVSPTTYCTHVGIMKYRYHVMFAIPLLYRNSSNSHVRENTGINCNLLSVKKILSWLNWIVKLTTSEDSTKHRYFKPKNSHFSEMPYSHSRHKYISHHNSEFFCVISFRLVNKSQFHIYFLKLL